MPPTLVISCHADTGFATHRLRHLADGTIEGHLDNFAGVQAVMGAYFSGRMDLPRVRIELTYGEEVDMAGAMEVAATLGPDDTVVVVDVTGAPTEQAITIEKCASPALQALVRRALEGLSYELFSGCPDPVSDSDECDVYSEVVPRVFFLGVPCTGGDYNAGMVRCRPASLATASEALIRIARAFHGLT
ncbi:MAG: hypothetical protein ABIO70_22275 [Pseudomonadota bacterium]